MANAAATRGARGSVKSAAPTARGPRNAVRIIPPISRRMTPNRAAGTPGGANRLANPAEAKRSEAATTRQVALFMTRILHGGACAGYWPKGQYSIELGQITSRHPMRNRTVAVVA